MKNKVTVKINGQDYTFIAEESEDYVKKIADYVDSKISEIVENARISNADAAVLAAANIADEYFKTLETSESLRGQLKEYLEEAGRSKIEINELKRELSRLKKQ